MKRTFPPSSACEKILLPNCCYDIESAAFAVVVSFASVVWVVTQRFPSMLGLNNGVNNTVEKDS